MYEFEFSLYCRRSGFVCGTSVPSYCCPELSRLGVHLHRIGYDLSLLSSWSAKEDLGVPMY